MRRCHALTRQSSKQDFFMSTVLRKQSGGNGNINSGACWIFWFHITYLRLHLNPLTGQERRETNSTSPLTRRHCAAVTVKHTNCSGEDSRVTVVIQVYHPDVKRRGCHCLPYCCRCQVVADGLTLHAHQTCPDTDEKLTKQCLLKVMYRLYICTLSSVFLISEPTLSPS